jgi:hypothetical protein
MIPASSARWTGITEPGYSLNVRLRLGQADDFLTFLELAALLQKLDALETFQDVPLRRDGAGSFETAMLRHKKWSGFFGKLRAGRLQRGAGFSTLHLKAPSTKIQAPKKLQTSSSKSLSLLFGA